MTRLPSRLFRNTRLTAAAALFAAALVAAFVSAPARAYSPSQLHEMAMQQVRQAYDQAINAVEQAIDSKIEDAAKAFEKVGREDVADAIRDGIGGTENGADAERAAGKRFDREGGDTALDAATRFGAPDAAAALTTLKNLGDILRELYKALDSLKKTRASLGEAGDTQQSSIGSNDQTSYGQVDPASYRKDEAVAQGADLALASASYFSGGDLSDADWTGIGNRLGIKSNWNLNIIDALSQSPAVGSLDTAIDNVDLYLDAIMGLKTGIDPMMVDFTLGEENSNGSDVAKKNWQDQATGQSTNSESYNFPANQSENITRVTAGTKFALGDRVRFTSIKYNSVDLTIGYDYKTDEPLVGVNQPVRGVVFGANAVQIPQRIEISDYYMGRMFDLVDGATYVSPLGYGDLDFPTLVATGQVGQYNGLGPLQDTSGAEAEVNSWDRGWLSADPKFAKINLVPGYSWTADNSDGSALDSYKDNKPFTTAPYGFSMGYEWELPAKTAPFTANDRLFRSRGSWGQSYDDQWALKRIGLDREGQRALFPDKATPVTVAVLDTGVDRYHPELVGAIWRNPNEIPRNGKDDDGNGYVDDTWGWNFVNDSPQTMDQNGHGTVTSGIIAAWPGNRAGIAGVNPWARIMPVKVADFLGDATSIRIAKGIHYAVDNGARVINISIAGKKLSRVVFQAVIYARKRGVLVVAAAGNDGADISNVFPGGLPGVITVSSTDPDDKRATFSNWGQQVEIAAPGVDILSLRAQQTDLLQFERADYKPGTAIVGRDKRYYRVTGTSFSAPFVSGVASLLFSLDPKRTAGQVKRMILHSARDIDTPGYDNFTGFGLLDARAAIKADPNYFMLSRIGSVSLVQKGGAYLFQAKGTAVADKFKRAWIELGKGENPSQWKKASEEISKPVRNGDLPAVPASHFTSAGKWMLKLVTEHGNGSRRESRFELSLN